MGKEVLYRVGQAAKDLGVSSYRIRRLCETGLISAEFSGHQWEIPESDQTEQVEAELVSGNYFQMLGVHAADQQRIFPHARNSAARRPGFHP